MPRHPRTRALLLLVGPLALVPLLGAAGQETDAVAAAAAALRRDPVHVDPDAERALSGSEADDLRDEIRSSGAPVFVAVLPGRAGSADDVVRRLPEETGLSGTYAVIAGDSFRATSSELANADELATAAFQAESADGPAAVLRRFVDEVAAASEPGAASSGGGGNGGEGGEGGTGSGGGSGRGATARDDGDGDGGGGAGLVALGLLAAGGAGVAVWASRRRRRKQEEVRAQLAADAALLRAELSVLTDDVLRLEPEVDLHPDARPDYDAAVERHRVASAALDAADERVDLVRVQRVIDEARYAMARAKALVADREPPPPPDDLRRPGRHQEPPIDLDERGVPMYAGGQPFYGGGWFGGGGGLFGGLLLGSMLGGWGWGWGGPVVIDHGGDGGGDGGDGGGGGFDGGFGGDIGGGDWGGDVGGGDW